MQGDERGRAGGVDGDRGALEAEGVGDAPGGDAAGVAGAHQPLDTLGEDAGREAVVVVHQAGEDAGATALEAGGVDARVLEGLPCGLQQQTLLRVHGQCLARRDPEEVRVEVRRVAEEPALPGVDLAGPLGVGVVERVDVPAAVLGELRDGVRALGQQPPQLLGGADTAGEPAAHAHDGDRLLVTGLQLARAPPGLA